MTEGWPFTTASLERGSFASAPAGSGRPDPPDSFPGPCRGASGLFSLSFKILRFPNHPCSYALPLEHPHFVSGSPGIAALLSVGTDDPMAGKEQGKGIAGECPAHGPGGPWPADGPCHIGIACRGAEGDPADRRENLPIEGADLRRHGACIDGFSFKNFPKELQNGMRGWEDRRRGILLPGFFCDGEASGPSVISKNHEKTPGKGGQGGESVEAAGAGGK